MGRHDTAAAENIKVLVRCRPLSEKEKASGHKTCVDLDLTAHSVSVKSVMGEPDRWTFDAVINNTFSQKDIFTQFIQPLVDSVLDGFNATVFAYGQSGSGKTHTMTGVMDDPELEGVIPRCFKHIFERVKEMREGNTSKSFTMYVSFVELYNGKVRDLLAKQQVTLDVRENKDHTFFVQGVHVPQVKFPEDIARLMEEGTERRRTAATELNADSSRSHSLFTLNLECTETLEDGTTRAVTSKLNLVDLAGSERQSKTNATGDTLKEGCNINLSLSALGTVIDTIVKGASHIPFRSSPLTMLLKDSLGGNSKTVMFANINPSEKNLSETVSTLRFADRAKQIKNKPVVNMDAKDQKIAELAALVHELRNKLAQYETEGTEGLEREVEKLRERVGQLEVDRDNAVNGREADRVDFAQAEAKLSAERQECAARAAESEERAAQLQSELQLAEASARDARSRLAEVLQLCAMYLKAGSSSASAASASKAKAGAASRKENEEAEDEPGNTIDGTNELTALLKEKVLHENNPVLVELRTEVRRVQTENDALTRELQARVRESDEQAAEQKAALQLAESKLAKLKAELQRVLQRRKAMTATSSSLCGSKLNRDGDSASSMHLSLNSASTSAIIHAANVIASAAATPPAPPLPSPPNNNNNTNNNNVGSNAVNVPQPSYTVAQQRDLLDHARGQLDDKARSTLQSICSENEALRQALAEANKKLTNAYVSHGRAAENGAEAVVNGPTALVPLPPASAYEADAPQTIAAAAAQDEADAAAEEENDEQRRALLVELDTMKGELEAERAQRHGIELSREKLYAELHTLREAVAAAERRTAQVSGELQSVQSGFARQLAEAEAAAQNARHAESRLQERTAQLDEMRRLLEKQRDAMTRATERLEQQQRRVRELTGQLSESEQQHRRALQSQSEQMQRIINERIESYVEERQKEAEQRNGSYKKLKKKLKKMQEALNRLEEDYDKKMCECEELRNVLNERNISQIRLQRRLEGQQNPFVDEVEVVERKEQISSALERAREERRRRDDLFDMGEVKSAKGIVTTRRLTHRSSGDSSLSDYHS